MTNSLALESKVSTLQTDMFPDKFKPLIQGGAELSDTFQMVINIWK